MLKNENISIFFSPFLSLTCTDTGSEQYVKQLTMSFDKVRCNVDAGLALTKNASIL